MLSSLFLNKMIISNLFNLFVSLIDWCLFLFFNQQPTTADKLMYIPNADTNSYPFCRLQLVVGTFGHLKFSKKFLSQPKRKRYYKTLRTCVINNPIPSFLYFFYLNNLEGKFILLYLPHLIFISMI